jgi:thioredoxin-dependent peroxiredoxin
MSKIKVGDTIPSFNATIQDDSEISDQSMRGKDWVMFFYGQDDTPTCTKQACSVSNSFSSIKTLGYNVIGISKDSAKKHQKFIDKYNLPYSIIADVETTIMRSFGLFGPKIFMGKEVEGIYRAAVLFDKNGIVTNVIEDIKSDEYGQEILNIINK